MHHSEAGVPSIPADVSARAIAAGRRELCYELAPSITSHLKTVSASTFVVLNEHARVYPRLMATCSKCGVDRTDISNIIPRPPCTAILPTGDECGDTALSFSVNVHESISISESISSVFTPGAQTRDWRQRWDLLQSVLRQLRLPRHEPLDAEACTAQLHRFMNLYVDSYSLKEALKTEQPNGLAKQDVEEAINRSADLQLVIDLANTDKHGGKLDVKKFPPRSGHAPSIANISGHSTTGRPGWVLKISILHNTQQRDGLDIAEKAEAAWEQWLRAKGLI